jgi:hypothetical protein
MYSGGADSTLALQLMLNQDVECVAMNVKTPFCSCTHGGCAGVVGDIILDNEIPVVTRFMGEAYLEMLVNPSHGYGRGMNPCIDCRIMMLSAAREVMVQEGASFVVTGEVVGQRPNSQMYKQMRIIEQESGLASRLLRPLSASLLPPTFPELTSMVDRSQLLNIQGRSREKQLRLGREMGLGQLPGSGGGCVLTEPRYADKVRDMYAHTSNGLPTLHEIQLLRVGRHFRLSPEYKVIVGRDEQENEALERLFTPDDILFVPPDDYQGPVTLVYGSAPESDWPGIASLMLRYCDVPPDVSSCVEVFTANDPVSRIEAVPMDPELARNYLI